MVSILAFQLVYNKFFVVQNLDRFAGIDRRSRINHEDVRLPHDDFPNSLHKSMANQDYKVDLTFPLVKNSYR